MASARYISRFLLASLAFLAVATTSASADKCAGGKVKAVGTKEAGLLTCQAKVAAKNDTSRLAACKSKAMAKFATTFVKAGTCVGDQTRCENVADGCDSAMAAFLTDTFPSKCESSKRKAAGKLASRELRCYSKATKKGLALDTSCITKAQGKFATALIKAGACPDGGSPQNEVENNCVQPAVTTNSGGMVTDVCPTCGMFLTAWGSGGSGDGQFNFPEGGAVDASGNVFIADVNNDRIQKFTNAGTFLTKWGSAGSGNGQFLGPIGVGLDADGEVFVADERNDRIQKFTNSGAFLTKWGSTGSGDGQFRGPGGVAVDGSGDVFVVDTFNARVQKFTNTGTFLTKWGSFGILDGQFQGAIGIAVDASGNVFVADNGNQRIQKFTNTGTLLTKWGSAGGGDGQFEFPISVAVDSNGNVFVADQLNDRVQKFTNAGTFLTKWGSAGSGNGQFNIPTGVAVDVSGNVFVADNSNNRIQKFACP